MRFIAISEVSSDCTARYAVDPKKYKTFGEFVNIVLTERNNEWGSFNTPWGDFEYKYGKLITPIPKEIINLPICINYAHGGWSSMDYTIDYTEKKIVERRQKDDN